MARAVHALLFALKDLPHPRVLRVLAASLALTLLIFTGAGAAIFFTVRWALEHWQWLDGATLDMAGVLVALLLIGGSWLLFRAVAILVVGLFADGIVADVEGRHYPAAAARAVPVSLARSLRLGLASVGRLIGVNLLALPLYIPLLFTGVGAPLLAFAINAALLGRDLEAMALARHPDRPRLDRGARWSLGALSAAIFLVPVANLLAPIASAAMAVHLLHLRDGEE
ncbi:EI24 domain-containing protein [Sphingopyxis sp.]|uniref:EI24 domain-containing protein n=1 Tax=Sphingopyxis sp. TaxID=1908224 RepID=UPI0035B19491